MGRVHSAAARGAAYESDVAAALARIGMDTQSQYRVKRSAEDRSGYRIDLATPPVGVEVTYLFSPGPSSYDNRGWERLTWLVKHGWFMVTTAIPVRADRWATDLDALAQMIAAFAASAPQGRLPPYMDLKCWWAGEPYVSAWGLLRDDNLEAIHMPGPQQFLSRGPKNTRPPLSRP